MLKKVNDNFIMKRRAFIRNMAIGACGLFLAKPMFAIAQTQDAKMLIIYFSHSGNTMTVAKENQSFTQADMVKILPKIPFPENYNALVELAEKQAAEHYLPEFTINLQDNINNFNVIFLGYPIWAFTMPMIIYSLLEKYKFAGKTIAPFCTHMGSGLADSVERIKELCPEATVLPGLAIRGTSAANSSSKVKAWLQKSGFLK